MHTHRLLAALGMAASASLAGAQIIYIDDSGRGNDPYASTGHFAYVGEAGHALSAMEPTSLRLKAGLFAERFELNRAYMMMLEPAKLLQNFYAEAGLNKEFMVGKDGRTDNFYWGWESLSGQLRGHFLGHYLSACAYTWAETGDEAMRQRADFIVSELARCQEINGGGWVGSIPEKYMRLMAEGRPMWSPQYTLHKTLMGLYDAYAVMGNKQALAVLDRFADWFHRWTDDLIAQGNASAIMGGETSGMLEIWADMYGLARSGKEDGLDAKKYQDLMERYGNPWLFTQLMKDEDALSSDHANASIPWSHGAARCYEVTGDDYWLRVAKAFWRCAVHERESYCTGGQNAGEHWVPKGRLATFAGENNQEHCTVYNMMRTADYLLRITGDAGYADYIERNLYNGILAQQHPQTGMVAYFLPMASGYTKGGEKGWGHPTMDFYCCHGSLVQAHNRYPQYIYYQSADGLTVSQYVPSTLEWERDGKVIRIEQDFEGNQWNKSWDADRFRIHLSVKTGGETADFDLRVRLPWWLDKKAQVTVDGKAVAVSQAHGFVSIGHKWNDSEIVIDFPDRLWTVPLPGSDGLVAIMEGPIVLAAEAPETPINGDASNPATFLRREIDQQYRTVRWTQSHYRTVGQDKLMRLKPLYEVGDASYTIYFPVSKK